MFKRFYSQNLIEKIVQRYSYEAATISQGDFVSIVPHRVMTHDNTGAVISKFDSITHKFHNASQIVFTLDHDVQNKSEANLRKYEKIKEFATVHQVDFYPAGRFPHLALIQVASAIKSW
jgi:homoaconitate hydratase